MVLLGHLLCAVSAEATEKPITKVDLKSTDKDVNEKLEQLHKVIDSLQETVKGLNAGYDQHAKDNALKMQKKFEKLSKVIAKLGQQKNELYAENKRLRQDKTALVDKISSLEEVLQQQAEQLKNSGAEAWLRKTAIDLKTFLEQSGLEHFASPKFSPLIAGIVANGVVIVPLAITTLFLLRFVKQLTVLKIVMALNLFDLGFVIAMIGSSALLLGDSFEGLRHISEVNFVFIQIVLAIVFWMTCGFLIGGIVQNRKSKAWKYLLLELALRVFVAVDYSQRVWTPVMDREDVSIALPGLNYFLYLFASVIAVKLTGMANGCAVAVQKCVRREEEDLESLLPSELRHRY